jgi:hypothetical protein
MSFFDNINSSFDENQKNTNKDDKNIEKINEEKNYKSEIKTEEKKVAPSTPKAVISD